MTFSRLLYIYGWIIFYLLQLLTTCFSFSSNVYIISYQKRNETFHSTTTNVPFNRSIKNKVLYRSFNNLFLLCWVFVYDFAQTYFFVLTIISYQKRNETFHSTTTNVPFNRSIKNKVLYRSFNNLFLLCWVFVYDFAQTYFFVLT